MKPLSLVILFLAVGIGAAEIFLSSTLVASSNRSIIHLNSGDGSWGFITMDTTCNYDIPLLFSLETAWDPVGARFYQYYHWNPGIGKSYWNLLETTVTVVNQQLVGNCRTLPCNFQDKGVATSLYYRTDTKSLVMCGQGDVAVQCLIVDPLTCNTIDEHIIKYPNPVDGLFPLPDISAFDMAKNTFYTTEYQWDPVNNKPGPIVFGVIDLNQNTWQNLTDVSSYVSGPIDLQNHLIIGQYPTEYSKFINVTLFDYVALSNSNLQFPVQDNMVIRLGGPLALANSKLFLITGVQDATGAKKVLLAVDYLNTKQIISYVYMTPPIGLHLFSGLHFYTSDKVLSAA